MECNNCKGKGLVGNGEKPWECQGAVSTCTACTGTGKVPEQINVEVNELSEVTPDEIQVEEPTTGAPDGTEAPEKKSSESTSE